MLASCGRSGGDETTSDNNRTGSASPATQTPEAPPAKPTGETAELTMKAANELKMKDHPLLAYFRPAVNQAMFTTCNREKSVFDAYDNGQMIPMDLVEKYKLYQFNISPVVRNKYRLPNAQVTCKGGEIITYGKHRILTYSVAIGMESEEEPEDEGVDIRALVLNEAGELTANYFLGGYIRRQGREEQTVCRQVTFRGEEMVLKLLLDATVNEPSHLRLEEEETRDLVM